MKAVIAKHHRAWVGGVAGMAGKATPVGKSAARCTKLCNKGPIRHGQAGHTGPAATIKWPGVIEKLTNTGNHLAATDGIISLGRRLFGRNGISSVKGVIETAKTGVRRIQRIACIGDRHDELWAGDAGDFGIDI